MRKHGIVRTATLSTAMTQILGPSENRVAIVFTPPVTAGQSYTLTTESGGALNAGLNLTSTAGILLITEELFGDAVKKAWYAASSVGLTIGFLETVCE